MSKFHQHTCTEESLAPVLLIESLILEPYGTRTYRCRTCDRVWWLVDDTYYDPREWNYSPADILAHAEKLRN